MAGKHIENALEKCDKLPKELIRDIEKQTLHFKAASSEAVFKWHNEENLEVGETVVELIYRVRVKEEEK